MRLYNDDMITLLCSARLNCIMPANLIALLLAASLSVNTTEHKRMLEQSCCLAHLSICLSVGRTVCRAVWWVNCDLALRPARQIALTSKLKIVG